MFTRLLIWIKSNPVKSFFLILFFPIYGFIFYLAIVIPIGLARDWYYEEFPFSTLAVRLFAEPGEDTLMFRYRLGDRLLYVRSDVAMPARYSGREEAICNPLWGECRVFPLEILMYKRNNTNEICIGRYPDCPYALGADYDLKGEFSVYSRGNRDNRDSLFNNACLSEFYISTNGNYKNYFIGRAAGRKKISVILCNPMAFSIPS